MPSDEERHEQIVVFVEFIFSRNLRSADGAIVGCVVGEIADASGRINRPGPYSVYLTQERIAFDWRAFIELGGVGGGVFIVFVASRHSE